MLRELGRGIAKRFGYEVLGYPRAYAARASLAGLLRQEGINLVLDVGANIGQFALDLRAGGYTGRILSVEPQSGAHLQLTRRAEKDPAWTVMERVALGAETSSVELNLSENSYSSSVLSMLPSHARSAPASRYIGVEQVPLKRLDDLYCHVTGNQLLLKMDVQGYERQVLQGAPRSLAACRAVLLEMSLFPLYGGQELAREMWNFLDERGFVSWAVEPGYRDPETGRMLQIDGLFVRNGQPGG